MQPPKDHIPPQDQEPTDTVDDVAKHAHIFLPIMGAVLIFMIAAIAVNLA